MSSSRTRNETTNNTTIKDETFNNVDNRGTTGEGSAIFGGNVNIGISDGTIGGGLSVTNTDYGAVKGGLEVAMAAIDQIGQESRVNAQVTQDALSRSLALAGETSRSEAATALQQFVKYGAMVAGVGFLAWAIARRK